MKTFALPFLTLLGLQVCGWADEEWNSFRGPTGMGIEKEKTPLNWNASSIKWKKEITGSGQSSVIQSGGKLFLTSADQEGGLRFIHCLDKDTGDLLWKKEEEYQGRSRSPDEHLGNPNPSHGWKQSGGLLWASRSALL